MTAVAHSGKEGKGSVRQVEMEQGYISIGRGTSAVPIMMHEEE